MKVLVVGSTHFEGADKVHDAFRSACRDLGKALADEGCELIVGSDSPNTADRHVVEGFLAPPGKRRVWVFRPQRDETPFVRERDANDGRIEFVYQILKGPWAAGRVPQIRAADAVILIGGAHGAAQVGHVARILERPVICVPVFGGAAAEMWSSLEPFYQRLDSATHQKLGNLQVAWQPTNAILVIEVIRQLRRRRVFVVDKLAPHLLLLLAVVCLLVLWVYLFVVASLPAGLAFFSMLGVSALLGTSLRTALTQGRDSTTNMSRRTLLNDLTAGLLLAFALAMIYLVGGFTITGTFDFISSTQKPTDFQRIALSMTILGLAGGWLIETVSERVNEWLVGQLRK
jgi:hypothetical protein